LAVPFHRRRLYVSHRTVSRHVEHTGWTATVNIAISARSNDYANRLFVKFSNDQTRVSSDYSLSN